MKTSEQSSDSEMLARIATGDPKAFACFYQRFQKPMLQTCRMVIHQHDLAQDALQDAMLSIWQHAKSYSRQSGSARAWTCQIAIRACLKTLHQNRKSLQTLRPTNLPLEHSLLNTQLHNEELALLQKALKQLPNQDRQIICSYYGSHVPQASIATQHAIPQTTVSFRIRKALEKLKCFMCSSQPEPGMN